MPIWIVYETRNLVNGKVYIGVHRQDGEAFDGYLGSGVLIRAAVEKYGEHSFERRTLYSFDNESDAYEKEREIVDRLWVESTATYNVKTGGIGGDGHTLSDEAKDLIRQYRTGRKHTPETRAKISKSVSKLYASGEKRKKLSEAMKIANQGRIVSPETREKIRQAMIKRWENTKDRSTKPETREKLKQSMLKWWEARRAT